MSRDTYIIPDTFDTARLLSETLGKVTGHTCLKTYQNFLASCYESDASVHLTCNLRVSFQHHKLQGIASPMTSSMELGLGNAFPLD